MPIIDPKEQPATNGQLGLGVRVLDGVVRGQHVQVVELDGRLRHQIRQWILAVIRGELPGLDLGRDFVGHEFGAAQGGNARLEGSCTSGLEDAEKGWGGVPVLSAPPRPQAPEEEGPGGGGTGHDRRRKKDGGD